MILLRTMSSSVAVAGLVVLLAGTSACNDSPTTPENNAPFSQTDVRLGTGADAVAGKVLTVQYTGWYYDAAKPDLKGVQFDSSVGGDPFVFTLGAGQVISGWDQGLVNMKVGGLRRLIIPPSLAYGSRRFGPIPPDATLVFDLELLQVE